MTVVRTIRWLSSATQEFELFCVYIGSVCIMIIVQEIAYYM